MKNYFITLLISGILGMMCLTTAKQTENWFIGGLGLLCAIVFFSMIVSIIERLKEHRITKKQDELL